MSGEKRLTEEELRGVINGVRRLAYPERPLSSAKWLDATERNVERMVEELRQLRLDFVAAQETIAEMDEIIAGLQTANRRMMRESADWEAKVSCGAVEALEIIAAKDGEIEALRWQIVEHETRWKELSNVRRDDD